MSDTIVTHRLQCIEHHLPVELEQDISQETCKPCGITRKPGGGGVGGGAGVHVKASLCRKLPQQETLFLVIFIKATL